MISDEILEFRRHEKDPKPFFGSRQVLLAIEADLVAVHAFVEMARNFASWQDQKQFQTAEGLTFWATAEMLECVVKDWSRVTEFLHRGKN